MIHESHATSPPWRLDSREDREEKGKRKKRFTIVVSIWKTKRETKWEESLKWRGDETRNRERADICSIGNKKILFRYTIML